MTTLTISRVNHLQSHHHTAEVSGSFGNGWIESFVFEPSSPLSSPHRLDVLLRQVPPQDDARGWVDLYFEVSRVTDVTHVQSFGWGIAVIDQLTFMSDFDKIYSGSRPDPQHLAVFFLVLALGSLFDSTWPPGGDSESLVWATLTEDNPVSREYFVLGRACLAVDGSGSMTCKRYIESADQSNPSHFPNCDLAQQRGQSRIV